MYKNDIFNCFLFFYAYFFYFILILALLLVSSYSYENQPNLSGSAVDPSERQHLYTSDVVRNIGDAVSINDSASEDPKNIPPKK